MKTIIKIFLIALLFNTANIFSQYSLPIRLVTSTGTPSTGKADSIKFTRYPHSYPTNIVGSITVTEIGTAGNYRCRGFTTWEYVKLWVNTVEQTWFDSVQVGNLKTYLEANYGRLGFNDVWTALHTFEDDIVMEQTLEVLGTSTFSDPRIDVSSPFYAAPEADNLVTKNWVETNFSGSLGTKFPINTNRIIVDNKQSSDVAGKIYNTIQEAINYSIAGFGTRSSTNRVTILIIPHSSGAGYNEDIVLYQWVDLVGVGMVTLTAGFRTTHTNEETFTGYDCKVENITVSSTNENCFLYGVSAYNCIFSLNGAAGAVELNFAGVQMNNCGFYGQNTVDPTADGNSLQPNRFINCFGNLTILFGTNNRVYRYDVFEGDNWTP